MKRRFATRKYATRKFKTRRFAGLAQIIGTAIRHVHYFILTGIDSAYNFILEKGPSLLTFIQKIKD
jgi:hypothetical protein